jgi:hypothetical protein
MFKEERTPEYEILRSMLGPQFAFFFDIDENGR